MKLLNVQSILLGYDTMSVSRVIPDSLVNAEQMYTDA